MIDLIHLTSIIRTDNPSLAYIKPIKLNNNISFPELRWAEFIELDIPGIEPIFLIIPWDTTKENAGQELVTNGINEWWEVDSKIIAKEGLLPSRGIPICPCDPPQDTKNLIRSSIKRWVEQQGL